VASVTSKEAAKFIKEITHRFGVPNTIIIDLGSAFTGANFWDFCTDNLIDIYYFSVAHLRCNGQVECANDMVLQVIKDHIFDDASPYATRWLAELPHVIWGLRTQVISTTLYSPFFLAYGLEAILPTNLAFDASHIQHYEEGATEEKHKVDLGSRAHEAHLPQAAAASLPRSQCAGTIFQCRRPGLVAHP
jgi:hypothetical protein